MGFISEAFHVVLLRHPLNHLVIAAILNGSLPFGEHSDRMTTQVPHNAWTYSRAQKLQTDFKKNPHKQRETKKLKTTTTKKKTPTSPKRHLKETLVNPSNASGNCKKSYRVTKVGNTVPVIFKNTRPVLSVLGNLDSKYQLINIIMSHWFLHLHIDLKQYFCKFTIIHSGPVTNPQLSLYYVHVLLLMSHRGPI